MADEVMKDSLNDAEILKEKANACFKGLSYFNVGQDVLNILSTQ